MAVKPGYKRLKELEHLTEDCGWTMEELGFTDIPENAEVVNITDKFKEGGPVVVTYYEPVSEEELEKRRRKLQETVNDAIRDIEIRYQTDPEYREWYNKQYGIAG